jgi:hypothetical protein
MQTNDNTIQRITTTEIETQMMTDLTTALIDQGLAAGLMGLAFTYGVSIDARLKYDVPAVAALRLLTSLPPQVTVGEVVARLQARAITLAPVEVM